MSTATAWADAKARLAAANLTVGGQPVPVRWPNTLFDQPDGPFLAVEIAGGDDIPIGMGGGTTWETSGFVFVHVFVQLNTGPDAAFTLVDQLRAVFRGAPFTPVIYHRVSADPGGPGDEDGLYWRTTVTAEWHLQSYIPRS